MLRFTVSHLCFFCFCFWFGSCDYVMSEEIPATFKEQDSISKKVLEMQTANLSSIRTWQGKAIVREGFFPRDAIDSDYPNALKYEVDFAFDVVNGYEAWSNQFLTNHVHLKENSLVKDGTYYFLVTRRPRENSEPESQLSISPTPLPLVTRFDPFDECMSFLQEAVKFRLSSTILETRISQRKENGISEEENEKFIQDIHANGFKDYKFTLNDEILTRELMHAGRLSESFVINMNQGASIAEYRTFNTGTISVNNETINGEQVPLRSWYATYQRVNGVWIPQKTKISIAMGNGQIKIKEIEWIDQKINSSIPEERYSIEDIGVVHGMNVADYRIGRAYKADGDEYPPEYELPSSYFSNVRLTFFIIGFLLIAVGVAGWIHKQMKNSKV